MIGWANFENVVMALTSRRFKQDEIKKLWSKLANGGKHIDRFRFRSHFDHLDYKGASIIKNLSKGSTTSGASKSTGLNSRATIQTKTSSSSQWETNVLEKLRKILQSSTKSLNQIFREFDEDGNGFVTQVEFRNAIRKLNLGLSSKDIDQLLIKIDTNQDGKIDYSEFMNKFKDSKLDERMRTRAAARLAMLKEMMILHMTSANDAFRFFDKDKNNELIFSEFSHLVSKVHELAGETTPTYPVIKDLFDTIDIRQDGILDLHEWQ